MMTPLEKLAREICWREFGRMYKPPEGKAAYWRSVSPFAKEAYIEDAKLAIRLWRYATKSTRVWDLLRAAATPNQKET